MDELADIVEYRQAVSSQKMAEYDRRIIQYHGPELTPIPPSLKPGEKEVIANFHDESSFHQNEYKSTAW